MLSAVDTRYPLVGPLRREINDGSQKLLQKFVQSLDTDPEKVHLHLSWGTPWQEVTWLTRHLNADEAVGLTEKWRYSRQFRQGGAWLANEERPATIQET